MEAGGDEFENSTAVEIWNLADPRHESAKGMCLMVQPENINFCSTTCAAVNATTGGREDHNMVNKQDSAGSMPEANEESLVTPAPDMNAASPASPAAADDGTESRQSHSKGIVTTVADASQKMNAHEPLASAAAPLRLEESAPVLTEAVMELELSAGPGTDAMLESIHAAERDLRERMRALGCEPEVAAPVTGAGGPWFGQRFGVMFPAPVDQTDNAASRGKFDGPVGYLVSMARSAASQTGRRIEVRVKEDRPPNEVITALCAFVDGHTDGIAEGWLVSMGWEQHMPDGDNAQPHVLGLNVGSESKCGPATRFSFEPRFAEWLAEHSKTSTRKGPG